MGVPFRKLEDREKELFQKEIDLIHDYFIQEVAENRGLPMSFVEEVSTGLFYTGTRAKELGLIDELGGSDEVKEYLEEKLNASVSFIKYEEKQSFLSMLSAATSGLFFYMGKGIGSALLDKQMSNKVDVWT